jgi:hypothetical protein
MSELASRPDRTANVRISFDLNGTLITGVFPEARPLQKYVTWVRRKVCQFSQGMTNLRPEVLSFGSYCAAALFAD